MEFLTTAKRTKQDLSLNTSSEEEDCKKSKSNNNEESFQTISDIMSIDNCKNLEKDLDKSSSIIILDGAANYANKLNQIKTDLEQIRVCHLIKETKITSNNHLIISFLNIYDQNTFLEQINKSNLFQNKKIIDLNQKAKNEIVIKGINFNGLEAFKFLLAKNGITKILPMSKSNQDYRMVRAECDSKEAKNMLIKNGLKIDYFSLKIENYNKPLRPIQCYNCQKYDHMAKNCPNAGNPVCNKCSNSHKGSECTNNKLKCANCHLEHASSDKKCTIYKEKLELILNKIDATNRSTEKTKRNYSEVINNKQDLHIVKSEIIQSITESITNVTNLIQAQIKADKDNYIVSFKNIENEINLQKAKQVFIDIDKMRLLNAAYTEDHIRKLHEIYKYHGNDFDLNSALLYNKEGGKNGKNNKGKILKYV